MKIKFGALVTDGSGKLGGHVVANNRGGKYMRTKVTPLNPQSTAQSLVRSIFAGISQAWSGLTEAGRTSFNQAVNAFTTTDIFGDIRVPSGKALFQRLNQNLALTGQTQLTVAPTVAPVVPFELINVEVDESDEAIFVSINGDIGAQRYVLEGTPPLSQGTSNANNRFRKIISFDGSDFDGATAYALYVAKFGTPPVGSNIQFRVKAVNSIGLDTPFQKVKATVVA